MAIGVPAALGVTRLMRSFLYGTAPHDALSVVTLCGAVAIATIAATIGPSRRALRIDPGAMMRGE